jgi:hypothetical protein
MRRIPAASFLATALALAACSGTPEGASAPTQAGSQVAESPTPEPTGTPLPLPTPDPQRLEAYEAAESEQRALLETLNASAATDAGPLIYMASTCVLAETPGGEMGMSCGGAFPMAMAPDLAAPGTLRLTFQRGGATQTWLLVQGDDPYTFTGDVQVWQNRPAQVMVMLGEGEIQALLTIELDFDVATLSAQYVPWRAALAPLSDLAPEGEWPSAFAESWLALTEEMLGEEASPAPTLTMDETYEQLASGELLGIEGPPCGLVVLQEGGAVCACAGQSVPLTLTLTTEPGGSLTVVTSNGMLDSLDTFWPVGQNLWMRQAFNPGGLIVQTLSLAEAGITVTTSTQLYDGEAASCEPVTYTFLDALPEWEDLQGIGGIVMGVAVPDEMAAALVAGEEVSGSFHSAEEAEGAAGPDGDGCYTVEGRSLDLIPLVQPDGQLAFGVAAGDGLRVLMPEEVDRYRWMGLTADGEELSDSLALTDEGVARTQRLQSAAGQEIVCESTYTP